MAGINEGFRIGFDYSRLPTTGCANRNMASTYAYPAVVSDYLTGECRQGRILGPFMRPPLALLIVSRFGVIRQVSKWRLIVDLSSPENRSVNDAIDRKDCSLTYVSVDDIAACLQALEMFLKMLCLH